MWERKAGLTIPELELGLSCCVYHLSSSWTFTAQVFPIISSLCGKTWADSKEADSGDPGLGGGRLGTWFEVLRGELGA